MASRFSTLYKTSFKNPHGDDGSYHDYYKRKRLITNRFLAMEQAFAASDANSTDKDGKCTRDEMLMLLAMFKLSSENATTVCDNLERRSSSKNGRKPRFPYKVAAKRVRNADYKKLERLPDSLTSALPRDVVEAAENQEDLICVAGLTENQAFTMMNRAFVAFDVRQSGLVSKHLLAFVLRMFGFHRGRVRYAVSAKPHVEISSSVFFPATPHHSQLNTHTFNYTHLIPQTARCDHNTTQRDIAYTEFIQEYQNIDFAGATFNKTFGPQPRSPHRNIKHPVADDTLAFGDSVDDLLDMQ